MSPYVSTGTGLLGTKQTRNCFMIRTLSLVILLFVVTSLVACGGGQAHSAPSQQSGGAILWMISGSALNLLQQSGGQTLATEFFSQSNNFIVGQRPSWASDWPAHEVISETSLSGIKQSIQSGVPAGVTGVVYDLEDWSFSPLSEQENPVASTDTAAAEAHQAGLLLIATPAVDLVNVLDPGATNKYDAYLSLGIPSAAKDADVFEVQAQGAEANTAQYAAFVTAAANAARQANPNVKVLAGLSTNPDGETVTAQQLYAAVMATEGVVDGYWLNVPSGDPYCPKCGVPQPQVAIGLLQMLPPPAANAPANGP